jgi:hypothetical protein
MTDSSLPLESIFAQALEIPPADQPAFLDRACSGNSELRAEIEGLLRAHEKSGDLLDLPEETAVFGGAPLHPPGMVIGP